MRKETERIVKDIKVTIKDVACDLSDKGVTSNGTWTLAILKALGGLGERFGYHVCPKFNEEDVRVAHEWLYDLIWYADDASGLKRIPLAAESEWSPTEWQVSEDFQKLLAVKADVKVFVAQDYEETINRCVSNIKSFEPKDNESLYLFVLFGRKECRFVEYDKHGKRITIDDVL